jgi:type II secretory pathway pseudopilin PulG
MSKPTESGWTLVELLVAAAILLVLCTIAIPSLRAYSDEVRLLGAARLFKGEFSRARSTALKTNAYTAIRFENRGGISFFSVYLDKDRDGVRSDDIAAGRDVRLSGPFPLAGHARGVRVAINGGVPALPPDTGKLDPRSDPIRFGRSRMVSFSPFGGATPGTFYLAGDGGLQGAVRVTGTTGRVRFMFWRGGEWRER